MSLPLADLIDAVGSKNGVPDSIGINSIWVIVAGCLVMLMQAGFAFLEIGFSRSKNAGSIIAKILTNFSIAGLCYWGGGVGRAFGVGGSFAGTHGWFVNGFHASGDFPLAFPTGGVTVETLWFFQF